MKAVILAAGRGTRMRRPDPRIALDPEQRRAAERGLKTLVPVAGRPLLDRLLERLAAAGVERVCLVAGAEGDRQAALRRFCEGRPGPPRPTIAVQGEPRGTADALLAARRFVGADPFLMLNSDNLLPVDDLRRLAALDGPGLVAYDAAVVARDPHSNVGRDRLAAFAAVEVDGEGLLRGIVEKPPAAPGAPAERLMSLNCWRFSPPIFEACAAVAPSPRGELELPAAVELAVARRGERFRVLRSAGPVLDLSRRTDIPAVAERLLARGWPETSADPDAALEGWLGTPAEGEKKRLGALARALADLGVDPARPAVAELVPGRIEVAGKHTDYAGGRTLTCATEQGLAILCAPRLDATVRLLDAGRGERVEIELSPALEPRAGHWSAYPATVARRLARDLSRPLRGFDAAFASDLPAAAGLSSSSVLVVAFFGAFAAANGLHADPTLRREVPGPEELAAYLGAVERGSAFSALPGGDGGVGTRGGDEDHTAILCARPGALAGYRFLPTRLEDVVTLPPGHRFAVAFSGVAAEKAGAARADYNRAAGRAAALAELWRDATGGGEAHLGAIAARGAEAVARLRELAGGGHGEHSGAELLARLDHFLEESESLVPAAAAALSGRDLEAFGTTIDRSQELASTLLGNQVPETEHLARTARVLGAAAASAFGAGFGGSVWSLVADGDAERFLADWAGGYRQRFPGAAAGARFLLTRAAPAARRLRLRPREVSA